MSFLGGKKKAPAPVLLLENAMDGGARWAAVHVATKSQTLRGGFFPFQPSPVSGCSVVSYNLGVLTGEDEHMSFYSAIFFGSTESLQKHFGNEACESPKPI